MKRRKILIGVGGLAVCLFVSLAGAQAQTTGSQRPAARSASARTVPAEYQAAIGQLRVAKGYLEKAGEKWGGYRVKAIASIDQEFKALGVSAESTRSEMQSGPIDEPSMLNDGISSLQNAKADFDKAGNGWGGRKASAENMIDQALRDLQAGIDWAKAHNTY